MNRIQDVETFVRIVEAGGVIAAAQRLSVSKSVVSRRLRDLEERLGVQLVARTTRQMSLTDQGRIFYERCARIVAELDAAESEAAANQDSARGTLRVAAPLSFGQMHLAPILSDFVLAHPELSVELSLSDSQVDLVGEGFDVALRIAKLADSTLIARRICPITMMVAASPAYWDANGRPQVPADLEDHRCLLHFSRQQQRGWNYAAPDGEEGSVGLRARMIVNNGEVLRDAAIRGLGVICEPTFIIHGALRDGTLEAALADHVWGARNAYAVYPPSRHVPSKVRLFIDFLVQHFGGTPPWEKGL